MIDLAKNAKPQWELLAVLSKVPVPIRLIAADLKISTRTVSELIKDLQINGYQIETADEIGGAVAWANPAGWDRIRRRAETYIDRVYG